MELLVYEPPTMYVEEVMMEGSFLGGSHEAYKVPFQSHEAMEETAESFYQGDFSFDN